MEDVDDPPLEVLSPEDGAVWIAAAPGTVIWGDRLVGAMSHYDKLAVADETNMAA